MYLFSQQKINKNVASCPLAAAVATSGNEIHGRR